jgi:hypothetical protein
MPHGLDLLPALRRARGVEGWSGMAPTAASRRGVGALPAEYFHAHAQPATGDGRNRAGNPWGAHVLEGRYNTIREVRKKTSVRRGGCVGRRSQIVAEDAPGNCLEVVGLCRRKSLCSRTPRATCRRTGVRARSSPTVSSRLREQGAVLPLLPERSTHVCDQRSRLTSRIEGWNTKSGKCSGSLRRQR